MSSTSHELSNLCAQVEHNGSSRRVVDDVVLFLMYNQYITSAQCPSRIWRVVNGTGMGLKYSNEVANYALYQLVEKDFAGSRVVQEQYGILKYYRYVDDIFMIVADVKQFRDWLSSFVSGLDFYPRTGRHFPACSCDALHDIVLAGEHHQY
jgi:hypothetical protein